LGFELSIKVDYFQSYSIFAVGGKQTENTLIPVVEGLVHMG